MRILVVQPTGDKRGHYGLYTSRLCNALARAVHDVTLCTNRLEWQCFLQGAPCFRIVEIDEGRYAFASCDGAVMRSLRRYYWGYFRNSLRIPAAAVALCRGETFDVVLMMDTEFLLAAMVVRWGGRHLPPIVMSLWAANFTFSAYAGPLWKRAYKVLQREVFRTALGEPIRALTVLGEWHRDRLREQLRLPPEFPIAVIPDGGGSLAELPDRRSARGRLGLPEEATVFLFFGILRRDKGLENLFHALSHLEAEQGVLVVAGWPMEYSSREIEDLVDRLGLRRRVRLRLEYLPEEEVPWYFAACDAVVFPYTSAYTGGTGPLMKGACTFGRPVIATDVSGMGQLVVTHGIGLVAAPDDSGSLAKAIGTFMLLGGEERTSLAQKAAALAQANSWDRLASRLIELFERVQR